MSGDPCLVVTSINAPNRAMAALASGAADVGFDFIVVGDTRSPADFRIDGCRFLDLAAQAATGFKSAAAGVTDHYARKNIGYLLAMQRDAPYIVETDDDTVAYDEFWFDRERSHAVSRVGDQGWVNVYRYFSSASIWPRGLPLDQVRVPVARMTRSI